MTAVTWRMTDLLGVSTVVATVVLGRAQVTEDCDLPHYIVTAVTCDTHLLGVSTVVAAVVLSRAQVTEDRHCDRRVALQAPTWYEQQQQGTQLKTTAYGTESQSTLTCL